MTDTQQPMGPGADRKCGAIVANAIASKHRALHLHTGAMHLHRDPLQVSIFVLSREARTSFFHPVKVPMPAYLGGRVLFPPRLQHQPQRGLLLRCAVVQRLAIGIHPADIANVQACPVMARHAVTQRLVGCKSHSCTGWRHYYVIPWTSPLQNLPPIPLDACDRCALGRCRAMNYAMGDVPHVHG